jgi:predicted nuclease with RNAse H fold
MPRFLGIDLASIPKRTAACLLEWDAVVGRIIELRQPVDDDAVLELAEGAELVAIDAPFGWPAPFVEAVSGHATGDAWPTTSTRELAYRRTDKHVAAAVGWWPLSVSTDRIGIVAFRAARLHALLRPGSTARDGSDGVVEVYPAAALHRWSLPHRSYKRPEGAAERSRIVAALPVAATLDLNGYEEALAASDDQLDAVVAALAAVAKHVGAVDPIPAELADAARVEGWIWLPSGAPLRSDGEVQP